VPRVQAAFAQTSDSAVFGKLKRKGSVRLAKAGRLRVVYEDGLELVSDGRSLIQFDPDTRTAQRMDLMDAALEAPLLRLLTDPAKLGSTYSVEPSANGQVRLKPWKPGLPEIRIEGSGSLPRRLAWTDASGAGQVMDLLDAHIPVKDFPAETFRFQAPKGTRWLGK
jgi:outer membrane lipoprotein-sorting protein